MNTHLVLYNLTLEDGKNRKKSHIILGQKYYSALHNLTLEDGKKSHIILLQKHYTWFA